MQKTHLQSFSPLIVVLIERGLDFTGWTSVIMASTLWWLAWILAYLIYLHPLVSSRLSRWVLLVAIFVPVIIILIVARPFEAKDNPVVVKEKENKSLPDTRYQWLRQEFDLQREQGAKVEIGSKPNQVEFKLLRRYSKNGIEVQRFSLRGLATGSELPILWGSFNAEFFIGSIVRDEFYGEIELRSNTLVEVCSKKWDIRITLLSVEVQTLQILLEKKLGTYHPKAIAFPQMGCQFMRSPTLSGGFKAVIKTNTKL